MINDRHYSGEHQNFHWLESNLINLREIISILPEIFVGKFLMITHFDGHSYQLNNIDENRGWKKINNLTYTELISQNTLKMNICDNYDQWVLLRQFRQIDPVDAFVNFEYFSLIDWDMEATYLKDDDEKRFINNYQEKRSRVLMNFWDQIKIINPETFVSDGSKFIYVTRYQDEIEKILQLRTS